MRKKILPLNNGLSPLTAERKSQVVYQETITYDENGEVLSDVIRRPLKQNGGGFVLSYTEKMCEFLEKTRQGATIRVFLYLAHHQQYGTDGIFGYRCSHKYLQKVLGLTRKSIYNALSALKSDYLVHEAVIDGVTEFMVNPNYITIGTDKKSRVREWNLRWEATNKQLVLRRSRTC